MIKNLLFAWMFLKPDRIVAVSGSTSGRISDSISLIEHSKAYSIAADVFIYL